MIVIPSGRILLDPEEILREARLSAGMSYADFGAGTLGAFVFPAAEMVGPRTTVFAVDILKGALEGIESRARIESIGNVKTVWGDIEREGGSNIDSESLDLVSMVNIAGLITKSETVLKEVKRVLKKDGKLLVVDWGTKVVGPVGPRREDRISSDEIRSAAEAAGMVTMKSFNAGANHWGLLFRKTPFRDYGVKEVG